MVRKRKAIIKAKLRVSRIKEDAHRELQVEVSSRQQQLLESPGNSPLAYYSPDNEVATELERKGPSNKGKGRADDSEALITEENSPASYQQQLIQQTATSSLVQDLAPNSSRDRPHGGFFESSSNVGIMGGSFHHIHGHQMNLTIQINPPRVEEHGTSQQNPQPLSPFQTPSHDPPIPPAQDVTQSQFPPTALNEVDSSTLTSRTIYSPDNSNKIYDRHLFLKERGFPLWIPEPNRRLPLPYRRKGVDIGDVGIITRTGAFAFLFNIRWPRGTHHDSTNPETLPEGFAPIHLPLRSRDIYEYSEFKPESFLASAEIEQTHNEPPFRGLSFATSSAEGAVLTFPDGAISHDLANTQRFRDYAKANIKEWYRYANGPLGREAQNGELRLITGCDKATSWGMAAVANITKNKVHHLKYRPVEDTTVPAPIPLYKWEHTGFAETRVGPDLQEIADLKRGDDSDAAVDGKYWNQCLFIRTLNIKLSPDAFAEVCPEVHALIQESQQFHDMESPSSSTSTSSHTGTHVAGPNQQLGMNSMTRTRSASESLRSAMDNLALDNDITEGVSMSSFPSAPKSHPADVLNNLLLQKFPDCQVIITQDKDWYSVINEDDKIMPTHSEIAARVLATHHIREEDGVVFLEPKATTRLSSGKLSANLSHISPSTISIETVGKAQDIQVHGHPSSARQEFGISRGLKLNRLVTPQYMPAHPSIFSHSFPTFYMPNTDSTEYIDFPYDSLSSASSPAISSDPRPMRSPNNLLQVLPQSQYMPTHSHIYSPDYYMTTPNDEDIESFINLPPDDSLSPVSLPSTSFHSRRVHDPPRATDQETEAYLRKSLSIPEGEEVNLWSLPDSAKTPKISDMIKLAIWGSPNHKVTLRQIYDAIETRYPLYKGLKDDQDQPWQRSIRHNLSLKEMFIREKRPQSDPGKGYYWMLDISMGDNNRRNRKRTSVKDEDEDADFSSDSPGGDFDTTPWPSFSPRRSPQLPGNAHNAKYIATTSR